MPVDQQGEGQLPGLNPQELDLVKRMFSSPLDFPAAFKAWLVSYLEANPPVLPFGQVYGAQSYIDTNVSNIQAHAPEVVTSLPASPIDGKMVMLRVGTAPYVYVAMFWDADTSQWVSEEFPAGGAAAAVAINGFTPVGGMTGISWAPVSIGGLTMQLKWAGTLENEGGGTADAHVLAQWSTPGSAQTSSTMMSASVAGDSTIHPVGVGWTDVSSPGNYDMVALGFEAGRNGGSTGTTTVRAGAVGRFIKPV